MIRRLLPFAACLAMLPLTSQAQISINEVDYDQPGGDSGEFVELYDGGAGNTSLAGHVLVLYNGSNGSVYNVIDLATATTNADGFYVESFEPNGLQNGGPDGLALFTGAAPADFDGTGADTIPAAATMVDSLVYEGVGTLANLGYLGPDLTDPNSGDNMSLARNPDGTGDFEVTLPTPGVKNVPDEEISASLTDDSISENGGTTDLTITLDSPAPEDIALAIEITTFDNSELIIPSATVLTGQTQVTVTLTGLDDLWRDFDQELEINVGDPQNRYLPSSVFITVTDDETGSPVGTGLRVNEVYAAVELNEAGDANGDGFGGATDGSDEFVELVNDSSSPLDISGYTLSDFATVRHTFPAGTVLEADCAIVVFGSGAPEGRPEGFSGALVQNANGANEFGLSLTNSGDIVSVKNTAGVEVAGATWVDSLPVNGSLTLDPDLNETNTYTTHVNFGFPAWSPGKTTGGLPFCDTSTLTVSAVPSSVSEAAGLGAATLSITRTGSTDAALTVDLTSSDESEATVQSTATFGVGVDEIDVPIDIVNDTAADGTQTVTFTAAAAGFVSGSGTLSVEDDGDAAPTIFINEVDYDQEGSDSMEFVEIYDGGDGNTPLEGFVIVAYNGNGGTESGFFDLAGMQTNAQGFLAVFLPSNSLQNGPDEAVALWSGAAAADFDGTTADSPPAGAFLVDAITYESGESSIHVALGYDGPDLADSNGADSPSLSRSPDGTGTFALLPPSPNASNGTVAANAYDTWASGFPGIGDREDDDDFDGIPNVLEFGLGFDPFVPNSLPDPAINGGTGNLRFTVDKGSEAAGDSNTTYFAATSTDGETWSNTDLTVVTDDGSTFAVEYTGTEPTALLRIGVNVTP